MPFTLTDKAKIAKDHDFIDRVAMAVYSVCYDVLEEDVGMPEHPVRMRLAAGFVQTPPEQMTRFAHTVVSHPDVAEIDPDSHTDIPDALILKIVLKAWNGIAGILE